MGAVAVVAAAVGALPAGAAAAETFGSRLLNAPTTGACDGLVAPCTYAAHIHPSDPNGDPYAGGAPSDGVITRFRIRAYGPGGVDTPATVTFRLARLTPVDADNATATGAGTGPTVTVAGTGEVEEFAGRLAVRKGDQLAIDTADANAIYAASGDKFTFAFSPTLVDGGPAMPSAMVTEELLVAATVEPDADGDGYGDETQDACPSAKATQGECPKGDPPGPDASDPRVDGVTVSGRPFAGRATLRYRLSEAARVTVRVERAAKGRRVAGKCRRQTKANRSRKRCVRWVALRGSVRSNGTAGANSLALPTRLSGRKLSPGRYRLVLTARDTAGNESTAHKRFRIKR